MILKIHGLGKTRINTMDAYVILFSIGVQFPKLDVAGSIPVSASQIRLTASSAALPQFVASFVSVAFGRLPNLRITESRAGR